MTNRIGNSWRPYILRMHGLRTLGNDVTSIVELPTQHRPSEVRDVQALDVARVISKSKENQNRPQ